MEETNKLIVVNYSVIETFIKIFKEVIISLIALCIFICIACGTIKYFQEKEPVKMTDAKISFSKPESQIKNIEYIDKPSLEIANSIKCIDLPKLKNFPQQTVGTDTDDVIDNSIVAEIILEQPIIDEPPNETQITDQEDAYTPLICQGFIISESGIITGCVKEECNLQDGLLVLPYDEECNSIEFGAFEEIKNDVYELFIPNNITYIAPGVLDSLSNLIYIQVMDGNPAYYSEKGRLYSVDGTLIKGR